MAAKTGSTYISESMTEQRRNSNDISGIFDHGELGKSVPK